MKKCKQQPDSCKVFVFSDRTLWASDKNPQFPSDFVTPYDIQAKYNIQGVCEVCHCLFLCIFGVSKHPSLCLFSANTPETW